MKKICAGLVLACIGSGLFANDSAGKITSHTFFSARPHFQSASPEKEMFFRSDRLTAREDGWGTAFQIVGFGGKSTESCDLARFFMPFGKTELIVAEGKVADETTLQGDLDRSKDIEARHFNIQSDSATVGFRSKIKFAPEQKFVGVGVDIRQVLMRCDDNNPLLWLEVSFPVEQIKNKMHLSEKIDPQFQALDIAMSTAPGLDGAPQVPNMIAAFKQSNWKYGKIDNKRCHSDWKVADVEAKLNWTNYRSDCCKFESYVGFVAPTGTKIDRKHAAYVFTPVIGNNHHWGAMLGSHMKFDLWQHHNHHLAVVYDMDARYLFENYQVRSFDLKDKQWSRYMEVYTPEQEAITAQTDASTTSGTSGINVFTKCVKVKPYYSATFNTALTYKYCNFIGELGYNFYVHHQEKVFLKHGAWKESVALKGFDGIGATSLARTIQKNFFASNISETPNAVTGETGFQETTIKYRDLDLNSAAHPAVFSNIIYGGLGYEWHVCDIPMFAGVGGSYEFSSINTAINHWMVWGKIGISL
jgi:hypothetical protein